VAHLNALPAVNKACRALEVVLAAESRRENLLDRRYCSHRTFDPSVLMPACVVVHRRWWRT